MNPNRDFDSITDSVLFNVFESLVSLDEDLQLKPSLAASWENPSPEIWRFHLRKDVHFHDGTLLSASDVRDSLLHVKGSQYETSNILSPVTDIKIVDANTLDLITSRPSALLSKLPFVYIFREHKKGATSFVGTGPYTIQQWSPEGNVLLHRFEEYWGAKPEILEARFAVVPDEKQRMQVLESGKADLIYYFPLASAANPAPGITVVRHTGLTVYYLGFELRDANHPFADPRVREAMHLVLDRGRMIQEALFGHGDIPTQPVAPFVFGFDPELPAPRLDLQRAQQLMEDAGYGSGFSVDLDLNASRARIGDMVRQDLARIHIDVHPRTQSRNEVYDFVKSGKSRFFLVGWDCSSGDASEFYEFNLHTPDGVFGHGNYGGYSNSEMDAICERHSYVMEEKERRVLLQKAGQIAMKDLPVLPLFMEDDLYGVRDNLRIVARADGQIRIADVHTRK